jgi:hypothetical protein
MGEFTSSVPIECDVSGNDCFLTVLRRLAAAMGNSLNHQASGMKKSKKKRKKVSFSLFSFFPLSSFIHKQTCSLATIGERW